MKRPLVKPVNVHGIGGEKKKENHNPICLLQAVHFQEDQMTKMLLCSDFTMRDLSSLFFIQNLK